MLFQITTNSAAQWMVRSDALRFYIQVVAIYSRRESFNFTRRTLIFAVWVLRRWYLCDHLPNGPPSQYPNITAYYQAISSLWHRWMFSNTNRLILRGLHFGCYDLLNAESPTLSPTLSASSFKPGSTRVARLFPMRLCHIHGAARKWLNT